MTQVTDFTTLHDAMAAEFKKRLPSLRTVEALADDPPSDKVITPALFIGVEEMLTTKKLSGGRVAITCTMAAYCVLSSKTPRVEVEILNMAASVASVVDGNHWGLGECVQRPSRLSAAPGSLSKGGKGLEAWVVQWEQVIHLGEAWQCPEPIPDEIYMSGCCDKQHNNGGFPNVDS